LVERVLVWGWTLQDVSSAAGVSTRTGSKWLARFRAEGERGLADRSSRPERIARAIGPGEEAQWERWRRERWTQERIARESGRGIGTVCRCMRRLGLSRLSALDPIVPVIRYEHPEPGDLLHIDTKKLGKIDGIGHRITGDRRSRKRGIGWDMVHVAIDDHSRVSFGQVLADEKASSCVEFLKAAVQYYESLGVKIKRVMTDNGAGYKNSFRDACAALGIRHCRTRPYTPRTNGKAERFIQTSLREWAYAQPYLSSRQRAEEFSRFLLRYNWIRPHSALGLRPPMSRIPGMNNLMELHS
jgi:transposase InsO family protein